MNVNAIGGLRGVARELRARMRTYAVDVWSEVDRPKLIATAIALVVVAGIFWPFYRKFFINEWRERIAAGQPVIFVPDCPTVSPQFKCGDRFTLSFTRDANNKWCSHVRKNTNPAEPETCGLDVDAWDVVRSWKHFTVEGIRLQYSWRGRVITGQWELAGWLLTPETVDARNAHPLAMR